MLSKLSMKYILLLILHFVTIAGVSQGKQYLYYFDKDLNSVDKNNAVFYGTGVPEENLIKLMLYNNKDKHLIMIEHFTDSTLQVSEGLFQSYFVNNKRELLGNYSNGKEDGLWLKWDENGRLTDSSVYASGTKTLEGNFIYEPGGKLISKSIHDVSKNTYNQSIFDENGNLIKEDTSNIEDQDKVFTKTEIEASFPGGAGAWTRYITHAIVQHVDEFSNKDYGTCLVKFIVDKSGNISEVEAMTLKNSNLAKIAVRAIIVGPKWMPAQQNGRYVKAYRIQPVTMTKPN